MVDFSLLLVTFLFFVKNKHPSSDGHFSLFVKNKHPSRAGHFCCVFKIRIVLSLFLKNKKSILHTAVGQIFNPLGWLYSIFYRFLLENRMKTKSQNTSKKKFLGLTARDREIERERERERVSSFSSSSSYSSSSFSFSSFSFSSWPNTRSKSCARARVSRQASARAPRARFLKDVRVFGKGSGRR